MEFQIIYKRILYTVSIDVAYNIWNEDDKFWIGMDDSTKSLYNEVKKYSQEYLLHLSKIA